MARKYPKLPNGFGSVKKLSGRRTNKFGVYPPVTEFRENGTPVSTTALAYVDDWIKGVGILTAYHNGSFKPGQEIPDYLDCSKQSDLIKGILAEYNATRRIQATEPPKKTFAEVYEEFFKWKFERDKARKYSKSTIDVTRAAYKNLEVLHNRIFTSLRHVDFQKALDDSKCKHASIEHMKSLINQMCQYAVVYEITDHDYSEHLKINIPDDEERGVPFSDDELKILWQNKDDETIEFLLIMCYSGFRILAYKNMEVNLTERYFKGGVKTKSGKGRIVPIHSAILPLVELRMKRDGDILISTTGTFRQEMYKALERIGIERHTPHDCRHTFSRLCERDNVNENDRKRMMGHSFGADITNGVYGHRTLEELRTEIEKIKVSLTCR